LELEIISDVIIDITKGDFFGLCSTNDSKPALDLRPIEGRCPRRHVSAAWRIFE
jgi:hypothetical protein